MAPFFAMMRLVRVLLKKSSPFPTKLALLSRTVILTGVVSGLIRSVKNGLFSIRLQVVLMLVVAPSLVHASRTVLWILFSFTAKRKSELFNLQNKRKEKFTIPIKDHQQWGLYLSCLSCSATPLRKCGSSSQWHRILAANFTNLATGVPLYGNRPWHGDRNFSMTLCPQKVMKLASYAVLQRFLCGPNPVWIKNHKKNRLQHRSKG